MDLKQTAEQFQKLSPVTQVALLVFMLIVIVLVVTFPLAGTSIITFLVALKMVLSQQQGQ